MFAPTVIPGRLSPAVPAPIPSEQTRPAAADRCLDRKTDRKTSATRGSIEAHGAVQSQAERPDFRAVAWILRHEGVRGGTSEPDS